jgi:uncharacterized SAM-binding protein YcdF (DUF218 family)
VTDLFFYLSKLLWFIVQPDHFLLLMLILGLLCWGRSIGKILVWFSIIIFSMLSVIPVGEYLIRPLEQRFIKAELPEKISGVILLGGAENADLSYRHGGIQFGDSAERVMAVPELTKQYPDAKFIFSGGSSAILDNRFKGADVAIKWFEMLGVEESLLVDSEARNTFENALYTEALIAENNLNSEEPWLLVTSAFHMPRSIGVFRKAGINVIPYPVDYRESGKTIRLNLNANVADLNLGVREWIGLFAYYLTDKTSSYFPGPIEHTSE